MKLLVAGLGRALIYGLTLLFVYGGLLYLDTLHTVVLVGGLLLIVAGIVIFYGKKDE